MRDKALCRCRNKQILLVVPTSVITNWQREFSTWGAFRVAGYHGPPEKRSAALQSILNGHAEILITSYDTYRYIYACMQVICEPLSWLNK